MSRRSFEKLERQQMIENVIKLTPYGYQTLNNGYDWSFLKQQNKVITGLKVPYIDTKQRQFIYNKSNSCHKKKKQTFSKKAERALQSWAKSQEWIVRNIEKQVVKRENQKSKIYEWAKMSENCKSNINGIIGKWDNSMTDERDRLKQRLRKIYERKYQKQDQNQSSNRREKSKNCQQKRDVSTEIVKHLRV